MNKSLNFLKCYYRVIINPLLRRFIDRYEMEGRERKKRQKVQMKIKIKIKELTGGYSLGITKFYTLG